MYQAYILKREAPIMIGLPTKSVHNIQHLVLMPGTNIMPKEEWDAIQSYDVIQDLIFENNLVMIESKIESKNIKINEIVNISGLPESEALAIISQTFNESALHAWVEAETKKSKRKRVLNALNEQINDLEGISRKGQDNK